MDPSSLAWLKSAGLPALLMAPTALAALVLSIVGLVGVFTKPTGRLWLWCGGAAACISGLGAGLGALSSWRTVVQIQAALGSGGLSASDKQELCAFGYRDARYVAIAALVLVALPLLGAVLTLALGLARAGRSGSGEPRHRALVAGIALSVALVGAVVDARGLRLTAQAAHDYVADRARAHVAAAIGRTDCDPCPELASGLELYGADKLEELVPGSRARAKRCVADRLQAIEADAPPSPLARCMASDEPPPPPIIERPEIDVGAVSDTNSPQGARLAALEHKATELQRLLASPLLIDSDERAQIEALLKRHGDELSAAQLSSPAAPPADSAGRGPRGSGSVGGVTVNGGAVANASAVVARMRARFRRCYQQGLEHNPDMSGAVTLVARVGPNGEVSSVTSSGAPSLAPITGCLKAVVISAQFDPPEGGQAVLTIPISFVKQEP
jgi:hypothetical protein